MKKNFITYLLFTFISLLSCNPTEPPDDNLQPGRRDYVWTADTLWTDDWFGITDIWGSSPNSIWVTASALSSTNRLWYYDGTKWERYDQPAPTGTLYTVFGAVPDEIWIGNSESSIWRNNGSGWQKFKEIIVPGFDIAVIGSIYGTTKNNLYAVGVAETQDGTEYKSIILRYDGTDWKLLNIPDIRVGFDKIRKTKNGEYLIRASSFDNGVFIDKLFLYDGNINLTEIYSDNIQQPVLYEMNGDVYISINKKIYNIRNGRLEFWKEFPGSSYIGQVFGRSEKDFFGGSESEGIMHYNGTDLKALYPNQSGPVGGLIFEKEVFFYGYNSTAVNYNYIMIKGTLK